jgi:hypothetical protein
MNKFQNNKILAVRKPGRLVRVWRATGGVGSPLVCIWVITDASAIGLNIEEQ